MENAALNDYILKSIPVAAHMGIEIISYSKKCLRLRLPLAPNHNHIGSLFGGSQLSCCAIACWAFLRERLMEEGESVEIVIQKNESHFYLPVEADTEISTEEILLENWQEFLHTLRTKKRARILLKAYVGNRDQPATVFAGHYVAKVPGPTS